MSNKIIITHVRCEKDIYSTIIVTCSFPIVIFDDTLYNKLARLHNNRSKPYDKYYSTIIAYDRSSDSYIVGVNTLGQTHTKIPSEHIDQGLLRNKCMMVPVTEIIDA